MEKREHNQLVNTMKKNMYKDLLYYESKIMANNCDSFLIHELRKEGYPIVTVIPRNGDTYYCLYEKAPAETQEEFIELKNANASKVIMLQKQGYFQGKRLKEDVLQEPVCVCPKCNSGSIRVEENKNNKIKYYCSNKECDFHIWNTYLGSEILPNDMKKLCEEKTIEKKLIKEDSTWTGVLQLDIFESRLYEVKSRYPKLKKVYMCPLCKSILEDRNAFIKCTKEGCEFSFSKKISKKILTLKEIDNYFTKGKTEYIRGFKNKEDKEFSCYIVFDKEYPYFKRVF